VTPAAVRSSDVINNREPAPYPSRLMRRTISVVAPADSPLTYRDITTALRARFGQFCSRFRADYNVGADDESLLLLVLLAYEETQS
jgi:hypothetical protein